MSELIERIARVQCDRAGVPADMEVPDNSGRRAWELHVEYIRQIFKDAREPTRKMLDAGAPYSCGTSEQDMLDEAEMCWQAMIDSELKE